MVHAHPGVRGPHPSRRPARPTTPVVRLVARTLSGLEHLTAHHLTTAALGTVESIHHRELIFTTPHPHRARTELRTADDLYHLVAVIPDIDHRRTALTTLTRQLSTADIRGALTATASPLRNDFDVTASFVGPRRFTRYDLEDAAATAITAARYHSRRHGTRPPAGTNSWRLLLRDNEAVLALRPTPTPLHRRPYKRSTIPGTLHPPLAAAMALLAEVHPTDQVVDPCCGAGTLLIEAAHTQPAAHYHGLDISPPALAATRTNATPLPAPVTLTRADAAHLPLAPATTDAILTNPPWSRQVPATGTLRRSPHRLWPELHRAATPTARLVCLLPIASPRLPGWEITAVHPLSLMGSNVQIVSACPY
jgi:tRNA (guanine6-N2)-methyltransferase